ncbi:MAG: FAD-dependent oxidoreductase [Pseudomonadota bacterium]
MKNSLFKVRPLPFTMESKTDILIIGAGLAGMSAAARLRGKCRVRIVEKEDRPGGLVVTDEVKGFRFDRTGHLLHLRDPSIRKWILGLMGGTMTVVHRMSRIFSNGVYTRYPFQSNTFGLPPQAARECLEGYLKVWRNPPRLKIRSFMDFINVHFGEGFAKHFMVPYNRKIWGVHPRDMTADWCARFVPVPRLEDVLAGAVGLHDRELGYNKKFYYPRLGIGRLSEALARSVGRHTEIELGKAVASIDHCRRTATLKSGEKIHYKHIISSMPLKALGRCIENPPAAAAEAFSLLRCNPLRYLDVALKTRPGTPYHWSYVPSTGIPFYRVGAYSNFSPALVPRGCGSLYVELASRGPIAMTRLMPSVSKNLVAMGIIRRASDIKFAIPKSIDYAYVVYDHDHSRATAAIARFLEKNGVFSIGRYGGWNYSAMEDALIMGRETALKIIGR